MDLIAHLQDACGLSPEAARALVGGVLGLVHEELVDTYGFESDVALQRELPELFVTWRVDALRYFGQAGRTTHGVPKLRDQFARVLETDGAPVDRRDEQRLVTLMLTELYRRAGTTPTSEPRAIAPRVPAAIVQFLRYRISAGLLEQILGVSPMLRRAWEALPHPSAAPPLSPPSP